jgi:type IV pilus assembly protein PilO
MRSPGEIWRQRLWIWVPALLFFLANAGAFAVYTLGYAGQIGSLQDTLDRQAAQVKDLKAKNQQMEAMITRVQTNEAQVKQLYSSRLSTRSQGLTSVTVEFRKLAQEAGLTPKTITFSEEEIQDYGLIKRSFVFSVQGTYAELRKFVSRLETSRSFFTVDEITVVNAPEGQELRVDLSLSTLFSRDARDAPLAPPVPQGPAPGSPTLSRPAAPPPAAGPGGGL